MSNHDQDKYGYSTPLPPDRFTAMQHVKQGCLSCHEDINPGDDVGFYDQQLMHHECALKEWEFDL